LSPPPPFVAPGALSKDSLDASASYNKVSLYNFAFLYHIQFAQLIQHLSDIIQYYFPLLFYLSHIYCLFIDYTPFSSSLYCALSTNKKSGSRLLPWARLSLFFFVFAFWVSFLGFFSGSFFVFAFFVFCFL